eukprot:10449616-Alexandrium_andersonii.AAC.1
MAACIRGDKAGGKANMSGASDPRKKRGAPGYWSIKSCQYLRLCSPRTCHGTSSYSSKGSRQRGLSPCPGCVRGVGGTARKFESRVKDGAMCP